MDELNFKRRMPEYYAYALALILFESEFVYNSGERAKFLRKKGASITNSKVISIIGLFAININDKRHTEKYANSSENSAERGSNNGYTIYT